MTTPPPTAAPMMVELFELSLDAVESWAAGCDEDVGEVVVGNCVDVLPSPDGANTGESIVGADMGTCDGDGLGSVAGDGADGKADDDGDGNA